MNNSNSLYLQTQRRINKLRTDIDNPEYSTESKTFADITSLPSTARGNMEKCVLEGQTATNIIKNGDFSNGTTGWIASGATLSSSNNILITTGQSNNRVRATQIFTKTGVFYVRTRVRVTNSVCENIILGYLLSGTYQSLITVSSPVINQWYTIQGVVTLPLGIERISISAAYVDAATGLNTVMEIDGTGGNGVTIIPMTGTEYENYTADQMNERFPSFFDGTKSVDKVRVLSVGKNLFDGQLELGSIGVSTGAITGDGTRFRSSNFTKVEGNTQYRFSTSAGETNAVIFYDINGVFISSVESTNPITTPANCRFLKSRFRFSNNPDGLNSIITLNEGSVVLPYEPYKPTQAVCPLPLRSISATIKDTFDAIEGTHRQNVLAPQSIATTVYASIDTATYTNVDVVKTTAFSTAIAGTTAKDSRTRVYNKDGVELEEAEQADIDLIASVGKYYYHTDKTIWLIIEKGTYADIAAARTGLGTSIAKLQLATPVVTYFPSRVLGAEASGAIYQEAFVEDWAFFDSGLALTDNTKLITNLVEVRKWDIANGSYVIIQLSSVTITTGVITDITGAVAGEFYTFDYNYSPTLSLNAGITYSHPVNAMGQIDVNTKSVVAIDRKTADMEKVIENLLARIEILEIP